MVTISPRLSAGEDVPIAVEIEVAVPYPVMG
jgi:hypothetical protein